MTNYKITTLPPPTFNREIMLLISNVIKHLWPLNTFLIHSSWITVLELKVYESNCEAYNMLFKNLYVTFYSHLDHILYNESNSCPLGRRYELMLTLAVMVCSEETRTQSDCSSVFRDVGDLGSGDSAWCSSVYNLQLKQVTDLVEASNIYHLVWHSLTLGWPQNSEWWGDRSNYKKKTFGVGLQEQENVCFQATSLRLW